jgi:hypothetical protein
MFLGYINSMVKDIRQSFAQNLSLYSTENAVRAHFEEEPVIPQIRQRIGVVRVLGIAHIRLNDKVQFLLLSFAAHIISTGLSTVIRRHPVIRLVKQE